MPLTYRSMPEDRIPGRAALRTHLFDEIFAIGKSMGILIEQMALRGAGASTLA